ncbi:polysaccharide biosynthesis protein [Sporosarcina aquimarina]|uniref:Nucleoside-diphosphate sugar epimerase/dehydratase n=1 Tax=Sporosarcina aquimarina TaxID=114975 RepID=A0ABU4G127_9BACL|nr:nucleoside-diphosphate sugar epimerase/dehydratase [Sporosarcina aquimarina]MDW0110669.1 nucleoside-diphosphate sugar epimerase/dehydratase [Sporosarcina aquimarina]
MSLRRRLTTLFLLDTVIVLSSIFFGYYILNPNFSVFTREIVITSSLTITIGYFLVAWHYGLYRKVWSYASIGELVAIFKTVTVSLLLVASVQLLLMSDVNMRALLLTWMVLLLLIGGSRLSYRVLIGSRKKSEAVPMEKVVIIGAGQAGTIITRQLLNNPVYGMRPIAFLDDDHKKRGLEILGIKIFGATDQIEDFVKEHAVDKIVVAIPTLSKLDRATLIKRCVKTGVKTKTLPCIEELLTGKLSVTDMKDVKIEDLLGRSEVKLDIEAIQSNLTGKTIMITGAGGSIGSEICRQVCHFNPSKIVLVGHGENSIYLIDQELRETISQSIVIVPVIADVQDRNLMFSLMKKYEPDVIYHAAAHKHVPLMEDNPREAVKNNIFGTKNVAEAADTCGVPNFVLVSTDKAVNPSNIMGATKRFAEMIIQNLAKHSETKFAVVRFGNVLGSRGSVIPLFKRQIMQGGPVTVTDPEMTRYFMTISEASRLVIQAGTLANGGEVFVLDMGEPVKIVDLAKTLIRLSGYQDGEIDIRFSGIRPGEKLYEELLNPSERQSDYVFPKIYVGKATPITALEQQYVLDKLLVVPVEEMMEILIGLANRKSVEVTSEFETETPLAAPRMEMI